MKKILTTIFALALLILGGFGVAQADVTQTFWNQTSPNVLMTNTGNGLANADIHVAHCYIGSGTSTSCGGGGGGDPTIGNPVVDGTSWQALFVDGSGNLAQSPDFVFDQSSPINYFKAQSTLTDGSTIRSYTGAESVFDGNVTLESGGLHWIPDGAVSPTNAEWLSGFADLSGLDGSKSWIIAHYTGDFDSISTVQFGEDTDTHDPQFNVQMVNSDNTAATQLTVAPNGFSYRTKAQDGSVNFPTVNAPGAGYALGTTGSNNDLGWIPVSGGGGSTLTLGNIGYGDTSDALSGDNSFIYDGLNGNGKYFFQNQVLSPDPVTDYAISPPVFSGTGLNDISVDWSNYASIRYGLILHVTIHTTGTPDSISWQAEDIATGNTVAFGTEFISNTGNHLVDARGQAIAFVSFGSDTGHTIGDSWSMQAALDESVYNPNWNYLDAGQHTFLNVNGAKGIYQLGSSNVSTYPTLRGNGTSLYLDDQAQTGKIVANNEFRFSDVNDDIYIEANPSHRYIELGDVSQNFSQTRFNIDYNAPNGDGVSGFGTLYSDAGFAVKNAIGNRTPFQVAYDPNSFPVITEDAGHVFKYDQVGDADVTIQPSDYYEEFTGITASRTATLPPANAVTAGQTVVVIVKTGATLLNTVSIVPDGSDTINGSTSPTVIDNEYQKVTLVSDGSSDWFAY